MAQRGGQERAHRRRRMEIGKAHRPDVTGEVPHPQRAGKSAEVLEELLTRGQFPQLPGFIGGQAGDEEFLRLARPVQGGDQGIPGAGQCAGAVQDALQHRVQVKALVDAQAGLAEAGQPLPQGFDFPAEVAVILHVVPSWFGLVDQPAPNAGPQFSTL